MQENLPATGLVGGAGLVTARLTVEFRIECVEVLAVQFILNDSKTFTETLIMDDFTFTEEPNRITDFRIFYQAQNVVVSGTGFLLWGDFVRTTLHNII